MYILNYKDFLLEIFASDLIKDGDETRLSKAKKIEIYYGGMSHRTAKSRIKTIYFDTIDKDGSGKNRRVKVQIPDYRQISKDKKMSTKEKLEMTLEDGDVKMDCSCPDFLYKGYKYIGTEKEYSIKPETIPPYVRNPNLEGTLCKHGLAVLLNIDKYINQISNDIDQYSKKNKK
jgi:hypothetical protein